MTIDELLGKYNVVIKGHLERRESLDDIKVAARIVIEERMTYGGRTEPSSDDASVALWSLCFIPIPGGPPKMPDHTKKAKRYRRKRVRLISKSGKKQKQMREDVTDRLRKVSPDGLWHVRFEDLFRTDEESTGREGPIGEAE